ncbi:class E sortase, partial [Streptomyces oryzae]|nr:class E sortase [Streptomyces oryzae]
MTTGQGEAHPGGEHGSGYDPYRAAVDALADPLNDPLPGQQQPQQAQQPTQPRPQQQPRPEAPQPPPQAQPGPGPVAADALYGAAADQEPAWYAEQEYTGQEPAWYAPPGPNAYEAYEQPYAEPQH